ncbi:MAG TPA: hypothetical protein VJZ00_04100 [Thermoanaerobaculia bacterium]|nr:hypothetical protein [Thermoanaerobaculia bacterium]
MTALLTLLLLATTTAAPAKEVRTDWMRPDAFHLKIGMSRMQVMSTLDAWSPKKGKTEDEVIVDYSDDKSMTLEFRNERLHSVRFELFVLLPLVRKAFDEERATLLHDRGEPPKATKSILIYDNALPNVMVVVTDDPKSAQGKQGLGVLAVRYYDPR